MAMNTKIQTTSKRGGEIDEQVVPLLQGSFEAAQRVTRTLLYLSGLERPIT